MITIRFRASHPHLDFDVELECEAPMLVLIGPNGAGKTSLLRFIAGSDRPEEGRIALDDRLLFDSAMAIDLESEERSVGYLPQNHALFPHMTVLDNVAFGPRMRGVKRTQARKSARTLLDELGVASLAERRPAGLSGGESQRVALARAMIVEPRLLMLDEPLAAVDIASRRSLRELLRDRFLARRSHVILVTHDLRDALALDAEIAVMEEGRILQRGSAAELKRRPKSAFVEHFFEGWSPR